VNLARVIEGAEAGNAISCAFSRARLLNIRPACLRIGGGIAVFSGPDSPLTHAVGVGFDSAPVQSTLNALEAFFRARRAPARLRVARSVRPDFEAEVERRGYATEDELQILTRRSTALPAGEKDAATRIDKRDTGVVFAWNAAVSEGFLGRRAIHPAELEVAVVISGIQRAQCFAGNRQNEFVGGAALVIHAPVAIFFGDAIRPEFRGKGVHHSLIRARLDAAREAACEWCVAAVPPASVSERNYREAGFWPAYRVSRLILPSSRSRLPVDGGSLGEYAE
jgi:GNAT superfamily N-acetyltransferase